MSLRDESSGEGCCGSIAMAERVVGSTAMSAKGRVRVSKHSAEELARLGRDDGVARQLMRVCGQRCSDEGGRPVQHLTKGSSF